MERSHCPEVRNPILRLASARQLRSLPPDAAAALSAILADLSADAATRAEASWRSHKGPMAAYWKAVAVYAKHIRRALASKDAS